MSNDDRNLFGLPGAECLYFSIAEVWESEIDGREDEGPEDGWRVEEWTTRPARDHLPSADRVVEWLLEHLFEDSELDEEGYESWYDNAEEADFEKALQAWASRVNYRMAHRHVGTHHVTYVDGEPHVDGEPMYVPIRPGPGQTDIFGGEVT